MIKLLSIEPSWSVCEGILTQGATTDSKEPVATIYEHCYNFLFIHEVTYKIYSGYVIWLLLTRKYANVYSNFIF